MTKRATPATRSARKPRRDWHATFLGALEGKGTVSAACKVAGISRSTAYRERQRDEDFAVAWADVESKVTDLLEHKALEVALGGDVRMLEFLLKARRPSLYRDTARVEHTGANGGPVKVANSDLSNLDPEEKRALLALLEKAGEADAPAVG